MYLLLYVASKKDKKVNIQGMYKVWANIYHEFETFQILKF